MVIPLRLFVREALVVRGKHSKKGVGQVCLNALFWGGIEMDVGMETCLDSKEIMQGKVIRVTLDTVRINGLAEPAIREVVWHRGAACVLPITDDGKILLVRQYRYAPGCELLEVPAGKLEGETESPRACAARELSEEGGVEAGELIDLGFIYTSPGFCNERLYMFLGRQLKQGKQHLDADEFVQLEEYTREEVENLIATNKIVDAKTIAIFMKAKAYL